MPLPVTRGSLESLFKAQRAALVGRLIRLVSCRETAEDLAHETYLRVARAIDQGAVAHLPTYLFQTARNLAIDHLRRERRSDRLMDRSDFDVRTRAIATGEATPERAAADRQSLDRLTAALRTLPERPRRILLLSRVEGLSYPEIAAHLGVSESTVYKDMRLALARCLEAVDDP
jgi:RNA polymerase sigma factor (sigma-70 family)